jgi:hypothetical protein
MFRICVLFIVSILFAGQVFAQKMTTVQFETLTHDFGRIPEEGGTVSYDFKFTNTGKAPLIISQVKSDCGCTTPVWPKEPIKPGKSNYIKAIFNPLNYKENFNKTITIYANTPGGRIFLKVKGYIVPKPHTVLDDYPAIIGNLRFDTRHINFGDVYTNSMDTVELKLYNPGKEIIRIINIKTPKHISIDRLPVYVLPESKASIKVIFNTHHPMELGYGHERIYLISDDAYKPEKEIIIVYNIKQNLSDLSPEQRANAAKFALEKKEHNFGTISHQEKVDYDFNFTNEGMYTLVIYSIKAECGCTATDLGKRKIEPGETGSIKVVFDPRNYRGVVQKELTVYTNDPRSPETDIKVIANVIREK